MIVQISQFMLQSCLPYIDKGIYGQDRAVWVSCCVAFRSAYVQYTSFKRLAGHENGRCLTLRPPAGLISAFSRKRNEVYWTYTHWRWRRKCRNQTAGGVYPLGNLGYRLFDNDVFFFFGYIFKGFFINIFIQSSNSFGPFNGVILSNSDMCSTLNPDLSSKPAYCPIVGK